MRLPCASDWMPFNCNARSSSEALRLYCTSLTKRKGPQDQSQGPTTRRWRDCESLTVEEHRWRMRKAPAWCQGAFEYLVRWLVRTEEGVESPPSPTPATVYLSLISGKLTIGHD